MPTSRRYHLARQLMALRGPARNSRGESGQVLVLFALGLFAFMGLVGMSIDVGNRLTNRRDAQNDADGAALAGAGKLADGGTVAQAIAEATHYATTHDTTVTVNIPPLSGASAGNAKAVEVIVTRNVPKYFIQVLYSGDWSVSARGVAKYTLADAGFGVVTLAPCHVNALQMDSNSKLVVTGGGVYVNSTCGPSFVTNSAVTAKADVFSLTSTVPGVYPTMPSPAPKTGQPPIPDPWAAIPVPAVTGSTFACPSSSGSPTLAPGVYNCPGAGYILQGTGTLTLNGPSGSVFVFRGGLAVDANIKVTNKAVIIIDGGGMTLGGTVTAPNGVLFYNKCNGSCSSNDKMYIKSNSVINVTPYGAPYADIVFFQQRNNPALMVFDANTTVTAQGGIYAASAHVTIDSNCTTPLQFVVDSLQIGSSAKLTIDVTNLSKISAAPTQALSE